MLKKIMLILVALVFSANFAFADCDLPAGVTDVPACTAAATPVHIQIDGDCDLYYEFCYRQNADGVCEVILQRRYYSDHRSWWEKIWEANCPTRFNRMREILMDKMMREIAANGTTCLNLNAMLDCSNPGEHQTVIRAFVSSCETALLVNGEGELESRPCTGAGYCQYEYTYCWTDVDNDGIPDLTYDRKTVATNSTLCDCTLWIGAVEHPCMPVNEDGESCYQDRIGIRVPTWEELENYATSNGFYINNQIRFSPINF